MLLNLKKINKDRLLPNVRLQGKKYILPTTGTIRTVLLERNMSVCIKKSNVHIPLLEVNSKDIIVKVSKDVLKLETT